MPPSNPSSRPPSPDLSPNASGTATAILKRRLRRELAADFSDDRPIRLSRAPGRLDIMGGIADATGSLICQLTLNRQAAVALQERTDRQVQVFSFNLHDDNKPFTLRIPIDALAEQSAESLRRGFNEPGRQWAAHLVGGLFILHRQGLLDLKRPEVRGLNLAVYSDIPMSAGVGSSGALQTAAMMNLIEHFALRPRVDPMTLATLCRMVENELVGVAGTLSNQIAPLLGEAGKILRMTCRPHELLPALTPPANVKIVGINTGFVRADDAGRYARLQCAASMAHKIILHQMEAMGRAAGRTLSADPMEGYLANLDQDDYKRFFRPILPQFLSGRQFLETYGPMTGIGASVKVDPDTNYPIQDAADHHIMEPRRAADFTQHLAEAVTQPPGTRDQGLCLDKAGHLMYASHRSYQHHALLSTPECDLLVQLVRKHEPAGLYGARLSDAGGGGTVVVLADQIQRAQRALDAILVEYEQQTGQAAEILDGSSDGAWHTGTTLLPNKDGD